MLDALDLDDDWDDWEARLFPPGWAHTAKARILPVRLDRSPCTYVGTGTTYVRVLPMYERAIVSHFTRIKVRYVASVNAYVVDYAAMGLRARCPVAAALAYAADRLGPSHALCASARIVNHYLVNAVLLTVNTRRGADEDAPMLRRVRVSPHVLRLPTWLGERLADWTSEEGAPSIADPHRGRIIAIEKHGNGNSVRYVPEVYQGDTSILSRPHSIAAYGLDEGATLRGLRDVEVLIRPTLDDIRELYQVARRIRSYVDETAGGIRHYRPNWLADSY